jgi:hypothetical protein
MGMNYLMANGALVILVALVGYVLGDWRTFATAAGGGGRYSPSRNTSEHAVLTLY